MLLYILNIYVDGIIYKSYWYWDAYDMVYEWHMPFLGGPSWVMDQSWMDYIHIYVLVFSHIVFNLGWMILGVFMAFDGWCRILEMV